MSALLQSPRLYNSLRGGNEQQAVRSIGRLAVSATDAAAGLESIASAVLRLPGLHGIQITPSPELTESDSLEWYASRLPVPCGSAMAPVIAGSCDWGRLRILFEPRIRTLECPLRFARFLGQQIAIMLNRLDLVRRRQALLDRLDRLRQRLEARKSVARASGIVAASRGISQREALFFLLAYAREWRRTPSQVAASIILGQDVSFERPYLRQLQGRDFTALSQSGT